VTQLLIFSKFHLINFLELAKDIHKIRYLTKAAISQVEHLRTTSWQIDPPNKRSTTEIQNSKLSASSYVRLLCAITKQIKPNMLIYAPTCN